MGSNHIIDRRSEGRIGYIELIGLANNQGLHVFAPDESGARMQGDQSAHEQRQK